MVGQLVQVSVFNLAVRSVNFKSVDESDKVDEEQRDRADEGLDDPEGVGQLLRLHRVLSRREHGQVQVPDVAEKKKYFHIS